MKTLTVEKRKEIITYLKGLGLGKIKPRIESCGLCLELEEKFGTPPVHRLVDLANYPEYSGYTHFPVESPNKRLNAEAYYSRCTRESRNKWIGRYGNSRKRLCLWMAQDMQKRLDT